MKRRFSLKSLSGVDGVRERKEGLSRSPYIHHLDDAELQKLKEVLFEGLRDFDRVARANSIFYTLCGGSVLGSVRHKGFIPWDDDIDLMMPRKDFEILKVVFDRELGDRYVLCAPELGHGHGMAACQIKRRGTIYRSYNELSKKDADAGIPIDIFVLESTFDGALLRTIHGCACLVMGYLMSARKTFEDYPYLKKYLKGNEALRASFAKKAGIGSFLRFMTLDELSMLTYRVYTLCRNDRSRFVTLPSGRRHFFKEMQPRKDLCRAITGEFEGRKVPLPRGYDRYLRNLYGERYMEVPPEKDRESHPIMELKFGDEIR